MIEAKEIDSKTNSLNAGTTMAILYSNVQAKQRNSLVAPDIWGGFSYVASVRQKLEGGAIKCQQVRFEVIKVESQTFYYSCHYSRHELPLWI